MLNALAQRVGRDDLHLCAQRAADGIAAQRQRQAGLLAPPDAEVEDLLQSVTCVRELAFVDDEPGVELARHHGGNDLVEVDRDSLDLRSKELQSEISRG